MGELLTLTFNKQSRLYPSNINDAKEQWDAVLRTDFITEGGFLKEGAYRALEEILQLDLTSLVAESLKYKAEDAVYLESMKYLVKEKKKILEDRVAMYAKVYNVIGTTAIAEPETDPSFARLHSYQDDPLAQL